MKNNRLIITYNESLRSAIQTGQKESFRVKSLKRAEEIVKARDKDIVKEAIWQDAQGVQHQINP